MNRYLEKKTKMVSKKENTYYPLIVKKVPVRPQ